MGKKIPKRDIKKMRTLAKTMKLEDVARQTGHTKKTVLKYCKGIRPQTQYQKADRPDNPCPICGSTWVTSHSKEWRCRNCDHYWMKHPSGKPSVRDGKGRFVKGDQINLKITKKIEIQIINLGKQGMFIKDIARKLGIHRTTVYRHLSGKVVAKR